MAYGLYSPNGLSISFTGPHVGPGFPCYVAAIDHPTKARDQRASPLTLRAEPPPALTSLTGLHLHFRLHSATWNGRFLTGQSQILFFLSHVTPPRVTNVRVTFGH